MRRSASKVAVLLAAAGIAAAGISGAYSYGRDYDLHRGFSKLVALRRAGTGRLLSVTFYSQALQRNADYLVYLPPHYNRHRRYPVYYLLHGMPGQPKVFVDIANMDVRLDNQLSLGHAHPMILVYPDGRIGGSVFSDSEWADTPAGAFESYVIEVMHDVDHRFSTLPRRQDRVIGGFSAGAYGAINIALHHPADFANVQSWSGYFIQTRTGVFAHAGPAALAYNSPLLYVARMGPALAADPLRVYLFVGRDDGDSRQQQPMIAALRAAGTQVQSASYPGGHDWSVWYPRLNQMLDLASEDTSRPLPPRQGLARGRRVRPGAAPRPSPAVGESGSTTARTISSLVPSTRHNQLHRSELQLVGALVLALISAALINLGFVLQHRGRSDAVAGGRDALLSAFREPAWLIGQGLGWIGFAGQVVAVALAPLTLVQAFSAGSLALSVPVATRAFGHRVSARQYMIIGVIALSLVSLPIGFGAGHGNLHPGLLIAAAMAVMLAAGLLAPVAGPIAHAISAGALYGAADAAIKAAAIALRFRAAGSMPGWVILAAVCTFGGFLCFQAALRDRDAVRPLSLMNAFTAVTAAALGVSAFAEPLGSSPAIAAVHIVAIALVLACVRPLASAQQRLVGRAHRIAGNEPPATRIRPRAWAALRAVAGWTLAGISLVACSLAVLGLLYGLRQLHWLAVGPRVADALPLLQLAGFAGQPLARVLVAGLAAGFALGIALVRVSRPRRVVLVGVLAATLMLAGSDVSYALARNLRLDQVMLNRSPGLGPWLEALLLVAGSAVPGGLPDLGLSAWMPRLRDRRVLAPALAGALSLAVAGALLLPDNHARALVRPAAHATAITSVAVPHLGSSPRSRPAGGPFTIRAYSKAAAGHLVTIYFYSQALHRRTDYLAYVPTEYSPARPVPVFYMLHGMPGWPLAFTNNAEVESKLQALIREHRVSPMILVFPDGRIDGNTQTDSEWANTPSGRFESYVIDVVHDVDRRFATRPCRQDRAIAGLSAGAYGAINIGLHQVADFGLIQVWSGYFIQTRTGVFAHATRAQLAYDSPLDYVWTLKQTLRQYPLRAFLYTGDDDPDRYQTPPMATALRTEGADAQYAIYPGGHDWGLWSPRIDQMLIMASRDFAGRCLQVNRPLTLDTERPAAPRVGTQPAPRGQGAHPRPERVPDTLAPESPVAPSEIVEPRRRRRKR